ncbi:MAG: carboxypeptidase regulatory-like domain-containing protein [Acidobacteria bacterium]|nr:carboxypeptidase regulatory-like domain-containing protein [Acidobacteriota bacterium]
MVIVAAPAVLGQVTTATISGTASDETGAVLPGVNITVKNKETGFERAVLTDEVGQLSERVVVTGEASLVDVSSATLSGRR